jgi:hypothetical protein
LSVADDLLGRVALVRIETSLFPTVELDRPFEPGPPNVFLQALQPKITLEFGGGLVRPVVMAPYGEPTSGDGVLLVSGLVAAGFAGVWLLKHR